MGFLDWMQRKGTIGSVVRWAYKHFSDYRKNNPLSTNSDILEHIFEVRYSTHPKLGYEEEARLESIAVRKEFETIIELCMAVYFVELEIYKSDISLYTQVKRNARKVLNSLNNRNKTNYA